MAEFFSERNGLTGNTSDEYSSTFRSAIVTVFFNQYHNNETGDLFYDLRDIMDLFGIVQRPCSDENKMLVDNKQETISYFCDCQWNQLFDFVEAAIRIRHDKADRLSEKYNQIFKYHGIHYRVVNNLVIPIFNEEEIKEIKKASHTGISAVDDAYSEAISLLAKKDDPDYNAVIAKASNALESMVLVIAENNDVHEETLGRALKQLKTKGVEIEEDLDTLLRNAYKYACNAGLRHGGSKSVKASENDAVFFLVIAAACINYLNAISLYPSNSYGLPF